MIIFNGIKIRNKIPFIIFKSEYDDQPNDQPSFVEIPIDLITADRIVKYLNKISDPYHGLPVIEHENKDNSFVESAV